MRKAVWMILTVLLVAMVAPCARADSVTFTCTGDNNNAPSFACLVATPTAPDVTFPSPTLVITWNSQTFDLALPATWLDSNSYIWLASNGAFFIFDTALTPEQNVSVAVNTSLPDGAGLSETGTLNFAVVATPEPGTVALMLLGIGLVLVMRKRIARGRPLAS